MRKIGTEAEIERKRKRGVLIISIFILTVLIFGTFGFGFIYSPGFASDSDDNTPPTNSVTNAGSHWLVNFEGQTFSLSNSPESVRSIPIEGPISLNNYVGKKIYIASENEAVTTEIGSVLSGYASRIQLACHGSCEEDLPEKDCTSDILIVIREGAQNKVYQDQSCTFIEGGLESADAFIYHLLGM